MKQPLNWEGLPSDLVPLCDVAKRLQVNVARLVKASRAGRFPPIFAPTKGVYLISKADLDSVAREAWTDLQEAAARIKARWILSRTEEAATARRQRAAQAT